MKLIYNSTLSRQIIPLLILILLAFPPRLIGLDQFLGPDEMAQWGRANSFLTSLINGDWAGTHTRDDTGNLTLMWLESLTTITRHTYQQITGNPPPLLEFIPQERPFELLAVTRLSLALANALLILLTYVWLTRLWNDWRPAFMATALLALDPFFLSESRMIRSEALYTAFMGLAVIALLLYLKGHHWGLWLSSLMGGLAVSSKITGLFLLGFIPPILALHAYTTQPNYAAILRHWLKYSLIWGSGFFLTMFILWPALWVDPFAFIHSTFNTANKAGLQGKPDEQFFMGQLWDNLPFYYYACVIAFRTTLPVWLGLSALLGYLFYQMPPHPNPLPGGEGVKQDSLSPWERVGVRGHLLSPWERAGVRGHLLSPWERVGVRGHLLSPWERVGVRGIAILTTFALLYTLVFSIAANKNDRYILTPMWILTVMAGFGLVWLGDKLAAHFKQTVILPLGCLLIIAAQSYLITTLHPNYIAYYNSFLSLTRRPADMFQLGYGEGVTEAIDTLNQQPNATSLRLVCGTNAPRCATPFIGETWQSRTLNKINGKWILADYVLLYITQQQRQLYPDGVVAYLQRQPATQIITIGGIDYAWLYPAPQAQHFGQASELTGLGTLLGYSFSSDLTAGNNPQLTTYWENDGSTEKTMLISLTAASGYTWLETPLSSAPDFTSAWQTRGGIIESTTTLTLPVGMTTGDYNFRFGFQLPANPSPLWFDFSPRHAIQAAPLHQPVTALHALNQQFSPSLRLVGHNLPDQPFKLHEAIWLPLVWQATQDIKTDYVILIRLLDDHDQEAAYWLGRPVQSSQATNTWQAGQVIIDPWHLPLPNTLTAGTYRLELALFDATSEAEVTRFTLQTIQITP